MDNENDGYVIQCITKEVEEYKNMEQCSREDRMQRKFSWICHEWLILDESW